MSTKPLITWLIWVIACVFYAYQYILRVIPNIMFNDIMQQFQMNSTIFGQFSGVYYISYSLVHLPIGIMLDRYGTRKIMTGCILLTVIGLLPMIFTDNWIYLIIGRAMIGMGSSAAILGIFKMIRMIFKEQHFTRMLGFSITIGFIGAIYGSGPVSYMCSIFGYKMVLQIFILVGILIAIITYIIVPQNKSYNHDPIIDDLKKVLANYKVIILGFFAGFMVGPLEGFADVWASQFLKQVYDFDYKVASYLPSMVFVGLCFGAPVLSIIAEKTGKYIGSIIGAGIIMLIIFIALLTKLLSLNSILISFIIVGICCSYQILAIYKASTYVTENLVGLTTAVVNMIIISFGYAFHSVIGLVINVYGDINVAQSFIYGVSVIPIALSIAIIGFMILAKLEKTSIRQP